jgi:hypothetical protein
MTYGRDNDLAEWMRLNLREFVLHVVWIHSANLIPRWCTKHFNDLHELVNAGFTREERLSKHQLSHYATCRPNVYKDSFVSCFSH